MGCSTRHIRTLLSADPTPGGTAGANCPGTTDAAATGPAGAAASITGRLERETTS